MKNSQFLSLRLFLIALAIMNSGEIKAADLFSFSSTYAPVSSMTVQQKAQINNAFVNAQKAFQQNHTLCKSRGACLKLDLTTLQTFIISNPRHPAKPFFQNIYKIIRHDSQRQIFLTQWVIFQSLSAKRQQEFTQGLRISPFRRQTVKILWGGNWLNSLAHYNVDDILTQLLQEIDHQHKNCTHHIHCLSMDMKIIENLDHRLAATDRARLFLTKLSNLIKDRAERAIFNTNAYLNVYNPLVPNWYQTLVKRKAESLTPPGYREWKRIQNTTHSYQWFPARITNGKVLSPP